MKKILIIVAAILTVIIIGLLIFLFVSFRAPAQSNNDSFTTISGYEYRTGVIVTNLKDSRLLLKADIVIVLEDKKLLSVMEENNALIRDRIISILRNISELDMQNDEIQEDLKNNIKKDLQNAINIDKIINIYFVELVYQ